MTSLHPAPPRHRQPVAPLRIALLGTGLPAAPDGGSIALELGTRLAGLGHGVTVYGDGTAPVTTAHRLRFVTLPAIRLGPGEPVGRTALAAAHLAAGPRPDVAFLLGATHAPLIPLIRGRGTAVAVHLGGLDGQRRRRLRAAERLAARDGDALIADSRVAQASCTTELQASSECIAYGAAILRHTPTDLIEPMGLVPGYFHLTIARSMPEHHLDVILEGYRRSVATMPLVVVGGPVRTSARIHALIADDPRIRLLDGSTDQRLLEQLHAHAICFLHGHDLGGTDPHLLRAMGAGTAIVGWDAAGTREVAGTAALYFTAAPQLSAAIDEVERYPFRFRDIGELMQERARERYDWNTVGEGYAALATRLARAAGDRAGMRAR